MPTAKLAKYVLAKLESDAASRTVDPEIDPSIVEHILPQNPSAEWEEMIPENLWDQATDRIGNLSLLEANLNRAIANASYSQKAEAYAQSMYELTKQIPDIAPEDWTIARLNARQDRLAQRAVHIWRSDFDLR